MNMQQISRRKFFCACGAVAASAAAHAETARAPLGVSPDQAIERLREGNRLFRADDPSRPDLSQARRTELTRGQQPFVAVLGCADSRTSPEAVFHVGLGEIFDVRVAGNSIAPVSQGSLEYAVAALRVPLVMVMGHQNCGAVIAAKEVLDGVILPGALGPMVAPIIPAVVQAVRQGADDVVNTAVRFHAQNTARNLRTADSILAQAVAAGRLKVVSAFYSLSDGSVDILPD